MAVAPAPSPVAERSPDFRRIVADTFSIRLTDNMAEVTFAVQTVDLKGENCVVQEVSAFMTLRSTKVLSKLLAHALENIEKQIGPIEAPERSATS